MTKPKTQTSERPAVRVQRLVSAPAWLLKREGITNRQWKQMKRGDVKNLRAAFDAFRMGSAYVNQMYGTTDTLERLIKALEQSTSVKAWGR